MSKYSALWEHLQRSSEASARLTFDEIAEIAGVPIDHSFLKYKKELEAFGWHVVKISMKEQNVLFEKNGDAV